ncbi:hypothetical protein FCL48_23885 [Desulforhopalus sp. IMCC35007]|nr:hypothetical protein FCL48_23885 [Desulforhopalus sp. IMCC35007]
MKQQKCDNCAFRSRYDQNPQSILGRIWRWHINWCPGWKKHIASLPDQERNNISQTYSIDK